jgi:hypothetical protein
VVVGIDLAHEVVQRARGGRDGDADVVGDVLRCELRTVDRDRGMRDAIARGDGDVGAEPLAVTDPPERRGTAMAKHSARAAREHRGEPARLAARRLVADGVDPSVHSVQPAGLQPATDRAGRQSGRDELWAGHDAELPSRQGRGRVIDIGLVEMRTHTVSISTRPKTRPRETAPRPLPASRSRPARRRGRNEASLRAKARCAPERWSACARGSAPSSRAARRRGRASRRGGGTPPPARTRRWSAARSAAR